MNVTGAVPVKPPQETMPVEQLIQSLKAEGTTTLQDQNLSGIWPGAQPLPWPVVPVLTQPAAPAATPPTAPPK